MRATSRSTTRTRPSGRTQAALRRRTRLVSRLRALQASSRVDSQRQAALLTLAQELQGELDQQQRLLTGSAASLRSGYDGARICAGFPES